jgi:hypothetical protein
LLLSNQNIFFVVLLSGRSNALISEDVAHLADKKVKKERSCNLRKKKYEIKSDEGNSPSFTFPLPLPDRNILPKANSSEKPTPLP